MWGYVPPPHTRTLDINVTLLLWWSSNLPCDNPCFFPRSVTHMVQHFLLTWTQIIGWDYYCYQGGVGVQHITADLAWTAASLRKYCDAACQPAVAPRLASKASKCVWCLLLVVSDVCHKGSARILHDWLLMFCHKWWIFLQSDKKSKRQISCLL